MSSAAPTPAVRPQHGSDRAPRTAADAAAPRELVSGSGTAVRLRAMMRVGVRMLFHDRLKLVGILIGVIFATVLAGQQAGTFLGLIRKNTLFIDNCGADVFIAPPNTPTFQAGDTLSDSNLVRARAMPGVAWASPILLGAGNLKLPNGGNEQVQIVGVDLESMKGGPWNVVAGDPAKLALPDAMFFEDSERERIGGLNLGSVREINGHRVHTVGFTWGLLPFGPPYSFASFRLARELMKVEEHRVSYVLVGARPGVSPKELAARLQKELPGTLVIDRQTFTSSTVRYILLRTPIGITFGSSALFGLLVGFVIVGLTMFSAVVDNLREFGTLKAIGAKNRDLALLLIAQAVTVALMGGLIGMGLLGRMASAIRSPKLALNLPPVLLLSILGLMVGLCVFASTLALLRLRKLEPAMVFRG
jgi:putative ABC transport system permease protein